MQPTSSSANLIAEKLIDTIPANAILFNLQQIEPTSTWFEPARSRWDDLPVLRRESIRMDLTERSHDVRHHIRYLGNVADKYHDA